MTDAAELILNELSNLAARSQELCYDHEEYQRNIARCLRKAGASWQDVGEAFGTTKQAAWERFRGDF